MVARSSRISPLLAPRWLNFGAFFCLRFQSFNRIEPSHPKSERDVFVLIEMGGFVLCNECIESAAADHQRSQGGGDRGRAREVRAFLLSGQRGR